MVIYIIFFIKLFTIYCSIRQYDLVGLSGAEDSFGNFYILMKHFLCNSTNNAALHASAHGTGGCQALYPSSWRHRGEQSKYHHLLGWLLGSRADDWRGSLGSFKKKQPMLEKSTSQRSQLSQVGRPLPGMMQPSSSLRWMNILFSERRSEGGGEREVGAAEHARHI